MEKFDLCVIGGGPSGYAAAMRAIDFGKKVLFIEKGEIGGTGVHNGALSSKTWWELSREHLLLRKKLEKYNASIPRIEFKQLKREVDLAVKERLSVLNEHLELLHNGNSDSNFVRKTGTAQIISAHEIEVSSGAGKEVFNSEHIIIATGSRPRKLPHIPIDGEVIITSDGISNLKEFPESMVILGAGVIGCEFATIFSNFGKTKVNLIDRGDRILPFEDEDVVQIIEENLIGKGATIHRDSGLIRMEIVNGEVEYELEYSDGTKEIFRVEKALVSVGRVPNMEGLWVDDLKIKHNERGVLDNDTLTNIPNIYAVGDVTADIALVNIGELEGRYAVERMFSTPRKKLVYENISTIMFLDPEVAGVGLNETQAKNRRIDYKVASLDYSCISRAVAMRNTKGFIKILVTNDEEMKILGMRVIGEHASSAIQAVALLISMKKGIEELSELVHPHPSITEGIQECTRMLLGKSMLKPDLMHQHMICKTCIDGEYVDLVEKNE